MPLLPRRLPFLISAASHRLLTIFTPTHGLLPEFAKKSSRNITFALMSYGVKPPLPISDSTLSTREVHNVALNHESDINKRFKILKDKLQELGFDYDKYVPGQYNHQMCPKCQESDTKEKSLSICIQEDGREALWRCFRDKCGWSGIVQDGNLKEFNLSQVKEKILESKKGYRVVTEEELGLEPLNKEVLAYLNERMISAETLRRNRVMQRHRGDQMVIAFTYTRNDMLVSCKYRTIDKKLFWRESNTERIFYGLDDIKNTSDIIIVEGEMDKLAMEEAGYRNCVSVPDGAPSEISNMLPDQEEDTKYQYLWNCKEYLEKASRIILAMDADAPGQALAEELARRIGKERCWRVKWPIKTDDEVCKDANEVLICKGPDALREVIDSAELYPIKGLFNFNSFFQELDDYYYRLHGYDRGISTGWGALRDLYTVVPGELTIISGVPNSGKSEWIDALICNINKTEGWTFALCSMENKVQDHARKLLEKYIGKPFFNSRYRGQVRVERMSIQDLQQGKEWLNKTFYLIRCEDDCLPSADWVLELAKAAVLRYGVRGLVIDPYNELDHQRPPRQTETEYVSQMLTKIKRFAQHHSCHVWFVAHPRQLQNWTGSPPSLYDISGSAHFINKCDNGIVIHRNRNENEGPLDQVQVCVLKVRNKVVGTMGRAFLSYNRVTGQFMDPDG